LRGWVQTDSAGRYSFNTIRPGAYPGEDIPQHIHLHIIEPGRCTYTVGDVLFVDDPRLTVALRLKEKNAYGGSGIVKAEGNKNAGWRVIRNITLGLNVPGYMACVISRLGNTRSDGQFKIKPVAAGGDLWKSIKSLRPSSSDRRFVSFESLASPR